MCRPACLDESSSDEGTETIHLLVTLPPPHTTKTAGRCRLSLDHWKKIAGPWHIKVLTHGIPLDWTDGPPQFTRPFDWAKTLTSRPSDLEACRKTLQHYLDIGSVHAFPDQSVTEYFKMEGLHTIQAQLRRRDHMCKVDMCRPACLDESSSDKGTETTHPSVTLPPPHTTKTAGRCRLSLDHWRLGTSRS